MLIVLLIKDFVVQPLINPLGRMRLQKKKEKKKDLVSQAGTQQFKGLLAAGFATDHES